MHISEGVLSASVLGAGAALSTAGIALGLKKIDYDRLPQAALLSALFFVATLIHLPVGPSSLHLVLNGLLGLLLGWAAFPAILVGLTLQAVLFGYGGLLVLGVNTFNMAIPAVICYFALTPLMRRPGRTPLILAGFAAGFFAVMLSSLLTALSLYLSGESFLGAAQAIMVASLPGMLVEGLITSGILLFLRQVRPSLLHSGVL